MSDAMRKYRPAAQREMLIEEMAELIHALQRLKRSDAERRRAAGCGVIPPPTQQHKDTCQNVIEEVADVFICLHYIIGEIQEDGADEFKEIISIKIKQLKARMEDKG